MVMPRRFSSSRRSGSVPVNARTSANLPWSMCPAVPTTTYFMTLRGGHQEARHHRRAMAPTSRPSPLFSLLEPFLEKLFQFLVHGVNVTGAVLALLHLQPLKVLPRFSGLVLFDHFLYQLRRDYHHSFGGPEDHIARQNGDVAQPDGHVPVDANLCGLGRRVHYPDVDGEVRPLPDHIVVADASVDDDARGATRADARGRHVAHEGRVLHH